jgi:hypothetical protein
LLVLLAGGRPAAAALAALVPATVGDSKPAPAGPCHARNDSAVTVYSSADSNAVRLAVAAAVPNDTVRLAGTCAGVAAQGGTTQTVLIDKVLTLEGGYSPADWVNSYPLTQPTTLDALSQGRVITASANFTISALTVQHGYSGGGNGGGIFAGNGLTAINPVNILSNTTLLTPTVAGAMSPAYAPQLGGHNGGGIEGEGNFPVSFAERPLTLPKFVLASVVSGNEADNGGGISAGDVNLTHVTLQYNNANLYGGAVYANGTLHMDNAVLKYNIAVFGGALATFSGATIQNTVCDHNTGTDGGCWTALSENQVNGIDISASNDTAQYGGFLDAFGPFVNITSSRLNGNTASINGGVFFFLDSSSNMANNSFIGNTAQQGVVLYSERFLQSALIENFQDYLDNELNYLPYLHAQLAYPIPPLNSSTGSVNPLASSTAPTGSAFFASGVTLFITDTIIGGCATDLETDGAISSAIVGDYNLFAQTPVISGTGITTGTHSIVGNPLFADNLGHLSAGSPAIDRGIDVGINVDLDGNHRPSGAGFDIGAYEFQVALLKLFLPLVRR